MTLKKKLILVNICGPIGALLSLFLIPRGTSVKIWALASLGVILSINIYLVKSHAQSAAAITSDLTWQKRIAVSLVFAIIAFAIIYLFR